MNKEINYPFFVLGLDIGGTKVAGGVLLYKNATDAPEIVYEDKVLAEAKKGVDVFLENICGLANTLKEKAISIDGNIPIVAIGMGSAGRIHKDTGIIHTATENFPGYVGCHLTEKVQESCGIPAFGLNDVQAHTLGEARWGAGKGVDNFVLVAVGTGIGGAVVADGKLLKGEHGFGGELGHVQVSLGHDIPCTCGKVGHLEGIASGSGIERCYQRLTGKALTGPEISALAAEGEAYAVKVVSEAGRSLGRILAMYHSIFDPEFIVLSGSVIKSGKVWEEGLQLGIEDEVIAEIKDSLVIKRATLGDAAAIIGACENALDGIKQ